MEALEGRVRNVAVFEHIVWGGSLGVIRTSTLLRRLK